MSDESTTVRWFGVKWDAPITDDAPEVPIPVGEHCMFCDEAVEDGESGITIPYLAMDGQAPARLPAHIECWLRSIMGGVAHQEHHCSCYGGHDDDSDDRSYRQEARELMSWLVEHRTK